MNLTAKQIARKRVQILFDEANRVYNENPQLAQIYLGTAKRLAMAARMRIPNNVKRNICKNCNTLLIPGESSRVRIKQTRERHLTVTCLNCGFQDRIALKSKKRGENKN